MILEALVNHYENLIRLGQLPRPGWAPTKISYGICLGEDGNVLEIKSLRVEEVTPKKTFQRPAMMNLPAAVKRSSGIRPNFLWDNATYLLGADLKEDAQRSLACFVHCRQLHTDLLKGVNNPIAKAIIKFFDAWLPDEATESHPLLAPIWQDLLKGANLAFIVGDTLAQEDEEIRRVWDECYFTEEGETAPCLVTGRQCVPQAVHPAIKGVQGAQSSGAAIVSFNAPAFCSYGKAQSLNAPIGKYAAFAYTTALNYLLADRPHVQMIGDTTVVCWSETGEQGPVELSDYLLFGKDMPPQCQDIDLAAELKRMAEGLPSKALNLDADKKFYILGLAPSAARLSVRFFYHNTFGVLMKNVLEHQKRLEITGNRYRIIPMWALLRETINMNTRSKEANPAMAGAVARSIFEGARYPAALLNETMLRIRAEQEITPGRAAILKAYYLHNRNNLCPEEVLTVALNEHSTNIPYTLGRLFAVYEALQETAIPGINTTIKDRFLNSASANPATIFPILDNLAQKHLRKLKGPHGGLSFYYDKQIQEIKGILGAEYPIRLSLPEQGSFNLGYYHQKQAHYQKKNSPENNNEPSENTEEE